MGRDAEQVEDLLLERVDLGFETLDEVSVLVEFVVGEVGEDLEDALGLAFRTSRTQYRPPPWRFSAWCVGAGPVAVR